MSYTYDYPRPAVTVDAVVYNLREESLFVLLVKRKNDPFQGQWALPGGFMDVDETPEESVHRELEEETGIRTEGFFQVGAFGALGRDPRHRTISIAYLSIFTGELPEVKGGDDADDAQWFPITELPAEIAFDHLDILAKAHRRLDTQLRIAEAGSEKAFGLSEEQIQNVLEELANQRNNS
jgi:8-oxo-dGTP diphosphatase